jgi:hypothetical protein
VDVNGDGNIDILSGSYSRHDPDMAGLFQVLWGNDQRTFRPAEVVKGADGEPLIITSAPGDDGEMQRICTRPTAIDLDADGKLDIVSGNFVGTFALFSGEGKGRFAPASTLLESDGAPLQVDGHSDPFFVDWDGDGDLDLFSGSAQGGVFLFVNDGTAQAAKFGQRQTVLAPDDAPDAEAVRFGDAHITKPQRDTRVWVDDVDGNGKLDLLVGDSVQLCYPAKGLDAAAANTQLATWTAKQEKVLAKLRQGGAEVAQEVQDALDKLDQEREEIVRVESTGFVWVLHQK